MRLAGSGGGQTWVKSSERGLCVVQKNDEEALQWPRRGSGCLVG